MRKLLAGIVLFAGIFVAAVPTTDTVQTIRELQPYLSATNATPCVVILSASGVGCMSFSNGVVLGPGPAYQLSVGVAVVPIPQAFSVTTAGTENFGPTTHAVWSGAQYTVYRNGKFLQIGVDFSESGTAIGSTITLNAATSVGDTIQIW